MAALSQWEIDLENNKNILNNLAKKPLSFLESMNQPADKIAPNIYGRGNTLVNTPVSGQSNVPAQPEAINIKNLTPTPKKQFLVQTQSQPTASDVRPSAMKQYTPEGGVATVTSTAPFPKPGSTLLNAGDSNNPRAVPVKLNQLGNAGKQTGITRGNGFEFEGTAEDAAKFMKPVGVGSQMVPTGRMIQAVSTSDFLPKISEASSKKVAPTAQELANMSREERRFAVRSNQLENDIGVVENHRQNNILGRDIATMREANTNKQILSQANQWDTENQLTNKKLEGDLALSNTQNEVGKLALLQEQNLQAAKDDYIKNPTAENKFKLSTLMYDTKKVSQQPDTKVIDKFDPISGQKIGQTVVRDDGSGNYVDAMKPQQAQEHPAIAYLRANDTPKNRAIFIKRYKKLPDDFK